VETKFHLLPVGQHFEWEGKRYVKTTSLIANQLPDGGQRFVPRSAMVKLPAEHLTTKSGEDEMVQPVDKETLRALLDKHHQCCLSLTTAKEIDSTLATELHEGLAQCYSELLVALKLQS